MKKRIEIRQKYQRELLNFSKSPKYFRKPMVSVVLKSPQTAKITLTAGKFMADTGASISIINATYESFLKELKQVDTLKIQYGAGEVKELPIFKVIFIINGHEIESTVAYDAKSPFLLLGCYDFFENFSYNIFDYTLGEVRLIKT